MASLNQLSTGMFQNNLFLNRLNKDDISEAVYDYSGGYNLIDFLATRNAPARRVSGLKGIFEKPLMGNDAVVAQVASTSLVGTNLRVNFTDPTYNNFRVQVTASDGTAANNQGRVIAKGPGYVILEPVTSATWNTATQFVAGSFATALFNASGNTGSNGMESLYEFPTLVRNQTSITRESVTLFRRDQAQTWVRDQGNGYWDSVQDEIVARRFANSLEYKALFSEFGTIANSSVGGEVNYSMGLRAAIRDPQRGGIYQPLSSAMTEADFVSWIGRIADRQALSRTNLTIVCGRGFLNRIQSFTAPYIQFGGNTNTFGGTEVVGLDVMKYAINGIHVDFIMHPVFNNPDMWPAYSSISSLGQYRRMQYTAIALDLGMIDRTGGGSVPAIEKCYFGPNEVEYTYLAGIGTQGMMNVKGSSANVPSVNDRDGISFEIYSDCAYDFMPYRMGWMELVV